MRRFVLGLLNAARVIAYSFAALGSLWAVRAIVRPHYFRSLLPAWVRFRCSGCCRCVAAPGLGTLGATGPAEGPVGDGGGQSRTGDSLIAIDAAP